MTLETTAANPSYGTTASGSSFYAAMRILPREQREAMFQIYSFCRQVDDIADSDGPRPSGWPRCSNGATTSTRCTRAIRRRGSQDYVASVKRFGLKREDFLAIIDGMEMDVPQDIRAPDLATLDLYCDRVASAVGRLSVRVFGLPEKDGIAARASSRPRAATDQHPARHRRGRRHRPALSAARSACCMPASPRRSAEGDHRAHVAESLRAAGRAGAKRISSSPTRS